MGVHGLWELLSPVGHRVSNDHVRNKTLAVDVSIWLTQFVKAMRDAEGAQPILVFDGATPALKRRTLSLRRAQREKHAAKLRRLAEKMLLNQIRRSTVEHAIVKKRKLNTKAPMVASAERPPLPKRNVGTNPVQRNTSFETGVNIPSIDRIETSRSTASPTRVDKNFTTGHSERTDINEHDILNESGEYSVENDWDQIPICVPENAEDLDDETLMTLPANLQAEVFKRVKIEQRARHRENMMLKRETPSEFSKMQIDGFLRHTALNRKISRVRNVLNFKSGAKQRIASDSGRKFILEEDDPPGKYNGTDAEESENGLRSRGSSKTGKYRGAVPNDLLSDIRQKKEATHLAAETVKTRTSKDRRVANNQASGMGWASRVLEGNGGLGLQNNPLYRKTSVERSCSASSSDDEDGISFQRQLISPGPENKSFTNNEIPPEEYKKVAKEREGIDLSSTDDDEWEDASEPFQYDYSDILGLDKSANDATVDTRNEDVSEQRTGNTSDILVAQSVSQGLGQKGCEYGCASVNSIEPEPFAQNDAQLNTGIQDISDGGVDSTPGVDDHCFLVGTHKSPSSPLSTSQPLSVKEIQRDKPLNVRDQNSIGSKADAGGSVAAGEGDEFAPSIDVPQHTRSHLTLDLLHPVEKKQQKVGDVSHVLPEGAERGIDQTPENIFETPSSMPAEEQNAEKISSTLPDRQEVEEGSGVNCAKSNICLPDDGDTDAIYDGVGTTGGASIGDVDGSHEAETTVANRAPAANSNSDSATTHSRSSGLKAESSDKPQSQENHLTGISPDSIPTGVLWGEKRKSADQPQTGNTPKPADERELSLTQIETMQKKLELEARDLRRQQSSHRGGADSVADEMYAETRDLLKLLGIPYLEAPTEAEAQCAYLNKENLVDGVLTEDSDVFLFGARTVYRQLFAEGRFAETYEAEDIQSNLGLHREDLVRLAYLLGSDYTTGVRGVGVVNSMEVLEAFPGSSGLEEFRDWANSVTFLDKEPEEEVMNGNSQIAKRRRFCWKHRNMKRNWELREGFPNPAICDAYINPIVDTRREKFSWGKIDFQGLAKFCWDKFGWESARFENAIGPLRQQLEERSKATQTRIDDFFKPHRFAKIRSERLQNAVSGMTAGSSKELMATPRERLGKRKTNPKAQGRRMVENDVGRSTSFANKRANSDDGEELPSQASE